MNGAPEKQEGMKPMVFNLCERFVVKPTIFLRTASLLSLLAFLGHTSLFVSYVPTHGAEEVALVAAMKSHHFNFGGFTHSYWELYFGYGLFVSISCLVEALPK